MAFFDSNGSSLGDFGLPIIDDLTSLQGLGGFQAADPFGETQPAALGDFPGMETSGDFFGDLLGVGLDLLKGGAQFLLQKEVLEAQAEAAEKAARAAAAAAAAQGGRLPASAFSDPASQRALAEALIRTGQLSLSPNVFNESPFDDSIVFTPGMFPGSVTAPGLSFGAGGAMVSIVTRFPALGVLIARVPMMILAAVEAVLENPKVRNTVLGLIAGGSIDAALEFVTNIASDPAQVAAAKAESQSVGASSCCGVVDRKCYNAASVPLPLGPNCPPAECDAPYLEQVQRLSVIDPDAAARLSCRGGQLPAPSPKLGAPTALAVKDALGRVIKYVRQGTVRRAARGGGCASGLTRDGCAERCGCRDAAPRRRRRKRSSSSPRRSSSSSRKRSSSSQSCARRAFSRASKRGKVTKASLARARREIGC